MSKEFEKGGISVQTEHIFPIIKRWLYSDKEIFLREIVSNASDAVTKLKRLISLGEVKDEDTVNENDFRIDVTLDTALSTITVSDNGIGMSTEEIKRYINQIALSGALDFITKYEGENSGSDASSGIIGHFGLGFYSAFMIADTVEIKTRSYIKDEVAAYWSCNESGEFEMGEGDRESRGTDIVMHVSEDEKEFLNAFKLKEILDKYCAFMPVPIYFHEVGAEEEHSHEEGCDCDECKECDHSPKPVNDTSPLWQKPVSECTEEEYKEFYKKVFKDYKDPLFHIHINADFPLNFKGILYFPKISHEYENLEGQVKLYYNQVFVADNIKEVIPEYMLLLKGVIDCPELPLNVSRSYLQNSAYVAKVSAHITKKISDKLNSLFNNERENYEKCWDDIKPFVEYGCLRDEKFFEKTKKAVIYKTVSDEYLTLEEYLERNEKNANVTEKTVYYAQSKLQQAKYIRLFKDQNIEVLLLDALIDAQFISFIESKNEGVKFVRIDSDIDSVLKGEENAESKEKAESALKEAFANAAGEGTEIVFESLKSEKTPAILTLSENERRFADMMRMYTKDKDAMPDRGKKLVINTSSALISRLLSISESGEKEKTEKMAEQIYMLAVLAQRPLTSEELERFVDGSVELLEKM